MFVVFGTISKLGKWEKGRPAESVASGWRVVGAVRGVLVFGVVIWFSKRELIKFMISISVGLLLVVVLVKEDVVGGG